MKILKKILPLVLLIIVPIFIIETSYYYGQKNNILNRLRSGAVDIESIKKNLDLANDDLTRYINKSKKIVNGSFDGMSSIEKVASSSACNIELRCISIQNNTNNWYSTDYHLDFFKLENPAIVKLSWKNNGGSAGISLIGRFAQSGKFWWQGRKSINIYDKFDTVEIYAQDGIKKDPYQLMNDYVSSQDNGYVTIYILILDKGNKILLFTPSGKIIKGFDVNEITDNKFPEGLFPDNKIYFGVSISPKAELFLTEFFASPLVLY